MVKQYNGTVKIGAIDTYYPISKVVIIKNKLVIDWEFQNIQHLSILILIIICIILMVFCLIKIDPTNIGNFTAFIDEKKYLLLEPYDVPKEIDHFKKWLRRIFSLKMVIKSIFNKGSCICCGCIYCSINIIMHLWK
jgi:amino acid transporter